MPQFSFFFSVFLCLHSFGVPWQIFRTLSSLWFLVHFPHFIVPMFLLLFYSYLVFLSFLFLPFVATDILTSFLFLLIALILCPAAESKPSHSVFCAIDTVVVKTDECISLPFSGSQRILGTSDDTYLNKTATSSIKLWKNLKDIANKFSLI